MKAFPDDCTDVENSLALAVGGDLEPGLRARVDEHVSRCPGCAERARALSESRRGLIFGLRAHDSRAPDLWPGIQAALHAEGMFSARASAAAPAHGESAAERAASAIALRSAVRSRWRWLRYGGAAAAAVLAGFLFGRLETSPPVPAERPSQIARTVHPDLGPSPSTAPIIPVVDRATLHRLAPGEPRLSDTAQNFGIEWYTDAPLLGNTSVGSPASLQRVPGR